ncbi:DnaJ-domain-containing protein [Leucogyrophana mollusca]|uniref:DnaJ-domain-containing protein n=1 Tax=Leucogyrophana mollusca TaxID=85980 RepID=A0ACB8B8R4_9AGAM|nr:DnaJ-domain-containing protein [Leucogyrophana mollusca]
MESNKDEALRCLAIAQKHRDAGNFPSARKFCQKSINLFSTPEAAKLLASIDAAASSSSASASGSGFSSSANATTSSTERNPSASGAKQRNGSANTNGGTAGGMGGEKREYTAEQVSVVKRVKACKITEYYDILAVKRDCEEAEIKKAYRKLALALHPDKNGAPGADEAFKMVSKAFQVLSDPQKRAAFDQNGSDPESRFSGMSAGRSPGFASSQGEMTPEDLFNMFFGGGMNGGGFGGGPFGGGPFGGPVFTASFGPGGFTSTRVRTGGARAGGAAAQGDDTGPARSLLTQLLPLIILFAFSFLTALPNLFSSPSTPDPRFSFSPTSRYNVERHTGGLGIKYHVHGPEFHNHPQIAAELAAREAGRGARGQSALSKFEGTVEHMYTQDLYNQCQRGLERRERRKDAEIGIFGIGTDWEKVKKIEQETVDSCEELKRLGVLRS